MSTVFEREFAARTVWMEARGEGRDGIQAVAFVIVNRVRAGRWFSGQGLADCVMLPYQFSCWNTDDPNRHQMALLADADSLLEDCRLAVSGALAGSVPDPTHGATHYYDSRLNVMPKWAVHATPTASIGHHLFFAGVE